jgi:STE24 endopeptidase
MTTLIVSVFLAFFLLRFAVETGLLLVNLRHVRAAGEAVPEPLRGHFGVEDARKSLAYTLANGRFALIHGTYGAALALAVLFSGFLPGLSDFLAGRGLSGAHLFVVYLVALMAVLSVLNLPFGLYHTFVIEARFGFNRTTWKLWLTDRLKGLAIGAALGVPLLYAVYGFMAFAGSAWWVWLFAFLTAYQVVMTWLYPAVIAPLFNKFQPLPEGELKQRLEKLGEDARFRNRGLFVVDASRRSGHSNAYFTGLIRPRIVLFDTLVQQMSVDEAAAVLAHEIGHYKARHIYKGLAMGLASMAVSLWVLSVLVAWPPMFQAFGFRAPSFHAALALFSLCAGAFTFFFDPLAAWFSRRHEYEADRFSVQLARAPEALESALVRLNRDNLSNLNPHPWYSRWHYSHPTLLERIAAIERAEDASPYRA